MSGIREPIDTNARRFAAGEHTVISGVSFRIVPGAKSPHDLRLDWQTTNGWQPIDMAACFYMADFFYENEDILYPRPRYQGGEYFRKYLTHAIRHGHNTVAAAVRMERTSPATLFMP